MTCYVNSLNGGEFHAYAENTPPDKRSWLVQTWSCDICFIPLLLSPHDSLGPSGLGSPADGKRRIVAPTVLCVGGVPKQNKLAIEAETKTNLFTI